MDPLSSRSHAFKRSLTLACHGLLLLVITFEQREKVFFVSIGNPYVPIQLDETIRMFMEFPMIIDAKALYDSDS